MTMIFCRVLFVLMRREKEGRVVYSPGTNGENCRFFISSKHSDHDDHDYHDDCDIHHDYADDNKDYADDICTALVGGGVLCAQCS